MRTRQLEWVMEGDCIKCISHKPNHEGYSYIKRQGKRLMIAHEIAKRFRGLVPGLCTRHTCDNAWCINPSHITVGTWADNNRDRMVRGRSATGTRSGRYKHGMAVLARRSQYKKEWYLANKERISEILKARYRERKHAKTVS